MRIATVIYAGSVATLAALATPALARHSDGQRTADVSTVASPCHAYEMTPDGSWKQLACQEQGAPATPARKSATRGTAAESVTR